MNYDTYDITKISKFGTLHAEYGTIELTELPI